MTVLERAKTASLIPTRLRWLQVPESLGKLTRFGAVGLFNSALYTVLCAALIDLLKFGPTSSSAIAFAACLPLAYWNQKRITFKSDAPTAASFLRFTALQTASFVVSVLIMHLCTNVFHLHYLFAIVATLLVVPLLSYVLMERWVF